MWIELRVGSRPYSEVFSESAGFASPTKNQLPNSKLIWKEWTEKSHCVQCPLLNPIIVIINIIIIIIIIFSISTIIISIIVSINIIIIFNIITIIISIIVIINIIIIIILVLLLSL